VLSRVPKAERDLLDVAVQVAADAVELIVTQGADAAQQRFNSL
jgi:PTH1 family peptidyl-tRNA hydrolase